MPEYILPVDDCPEFEQLPPLVRGYIEAAFFTSEDVDECYGDSGVPVGAGPGDLAAPSLGEILADCKRFADAFTADLAALVGADWDGRGPYDLEAAGRDLWYTRNGHGVGFWDRGFNGPAREAAARISEGLGWRTAFPETMLYKGNDGLIHHGAG